MKRTSWLSKVHGLVAGGSSGVRSRGRVARRRGVAVHGLERLEERRVLAAPDAPTGLIPIAGDTRVSLSWSVPNDNGTPIVDYLVQFRDVSDPLNPWVLYDDGVSADPSVIVAELENGTAYQFQVSAFNQDSEPGPYSSPSSSVTPAGLPFAPAVVGIAVDDSAVTLTWTVPDGNGAEITTYVVEYAVENSPDAQTVEFVADNSGTEQTATVDGLQNGVAYVFRVAAKNGVTIDGVSQGEFSDATEPQTPSAKPATPTVTSAVPADVGGAVTLTWTDLQATDPTIGSYVVEYREVDGDWQEIPKTFVTNSASIEDLIDGTSYVFRVAAQNIYGRVGDFSAQSDAVTPAPIPGVPEILSAEADGSSVVLTFSEADGFGFAIAYYVIRKSTDGGATWTDVSGSFSAPEATVIALSPGVAHVFEVAAVNEFGRQGDWSPQSAEVTPVGAPEAPGNLVAKPGDRSVRLSWDLPASDGGLPILKYVILGQPASGSPFLREVAATTTSLTINGLRNGVAYSFTIKAVTASFESGAATFPDAIPLAPPTRLVGRASSGEVLLAWVGPATPRGMPVTDYVIEQSADGGSSWTAVEDGVSRATRVRITGLDNGVRYTFRVAAVTSAGLGDYATQTVTLTPFQPGAVPAAPTGVTGAGMGGNVVLSWTPPVQNAGGSVSGYVIQYRLNLPGAKWVTVTNATFEGNTATIRRLVAGRNYVFRMAARNLAGQGAFAESPVTMA